MPKPEMMPARSPRGAKPVSQAFLLALDNIPSSSRVAVAKAAQTMIRDELKARRNKAKAATAKLKLTAKKLAPVGKVAPPKSTARATRLALDAKAPARAAKVSPAVKATPKKSVAKTGAVVQAAPTN